MADSDLAEIRKQCITSLYLCTDNVSKYLEEEKEASFDKLKSYVHNYCMLEAQQDVAKQALDRAREETDASNLDTLQDRFTAHLRAMAGERLNVDNHPYMLEFRRRRQKAQRLATQNLEDSDLAITESQDQLIDPITKKPIVDPVKNTVCGHVYEKESIMNLMSMNSSCKCPVAGCGNRSRIKETLLVSDDELKFRMTLTQHSTMIQERTITNLDESI